MSGQFEFYDFLPLNFVESIFKIFNFHRKNSFKNIHHDVTERIIISKVFSKKSLFHQKWHQSDFS